MTIRSKLILISALIVSFSVIVGGISFYATKAINLKYQSLVQTTLPAMESLKKIQFAGLRIVSSTSELSLLLTEGKNNKQNLSTLAENKLLINGIKELKHELIKYQANFSHLSINQDTINLLCTSAHSLIQQSHQIVSLKKTGVIGNKIIQEKKVFEEFEVQFLEIIHLAINTMERQVLHDEEETQDSIQNSIYLITLFSVCGIVAAFILVYFFSKHITKPLTEIKSAIKRISHGEKQVKINNVSADEFGQVASSINQMAIDLDELTFKLLYAKETAESAMIEAERANTAKSEFLSRMSHELRTPLNAISGFSQLLKFDLDPKHTEQREAASHIFNAGEHLLNLINEILDIAKTNAEEIKLTIESTSLNTVLNESLMLVKNFAIEKNITISDLPINSPWVQADDRRLKQIFVNLFSNAIKYNKNNGNIFITYDPPNGDMLRICIADTGIGINQDNQSAIFDPFYRVGNQSDIEGSGIGLCVVKKLIKTMNGGIGVISKPGEGSTFWVEIPLTKNANELLNEEGITALPTLVLDNDQSKKLILYVEDNPANQDLMTSIFNKIPAYTLLSTNNAEQGLDLTTEYDFDLILMDIDLPGIDGFEAFAKLQSDPKTATIPVIAISAHTMPKHLTQITEAGFNHYISKPIQVEQLMVIINKVLAT